MFKGVKTNQPKTNQLKTNQLKTNQSNNQSKNRNNNKLNKTVISIIKNIKDYKDLFSYEGGDGFQSVSIKLNPDSAIKADAGAMNYMDSHITMNTETGNLGSAFGRMFSGSSFFYNIFKNEGNKVGYVNLAGINPGNVCAIYIPKGFSLNLVSSTYICSTTNLDIDTSIKLSGFLTGYGLTFVRVSANNSDGIIWASTFGNIIEKIIKPGDSLLVDNGVILGFDANTKMNTTVMKGFKSMFFSGEGFVSKITNNNSKNLKIFLQSRSKIAYLEYLKKTLNPKK